MHFGVRNGAGTFLCLLPRISSAIDAPPRPFALAGIGGVLGNETRGGVTMRRYLTHALAGLVAVAVVALPVAAVLADDDDGERGDRGDRPRMQRLRDRDPDRRSEDAPPRDWDRDGGRPRRTWRDAPPWAGRDEDRPRRGLSRGARPWMREGGERGGPPSMRGRGDPAERGRGPMMAPRERGERGGPPFMRGRGPMMGRRGEGRGSMMAPRGRGPQMGPRQRGARGGPPWMRGRCGGDEPWTPLRPDRRPLGQRWM